MAVVEGVHGQGTGEGVGGELRPDVVLGEDLVHAKVLDPRREAFVQPQMRPPFLKCDVIILRIFLNQVMNYFSELFFK